MEGTQDKRGGWFSISIDDPSEPSTNGTTTFEQRKIFHSEETSNQVCAKRLKTRKETNAPYIDRIVEPGQKLPDMPDSMKRKASASSPLLSPSTPSPRAVNELSGSSSRDTAKPISNSLIVVDDDPVVEYQRAHLVSDKGRPEQAEEVLSARRIPKSNPGKKLRKEFSENVSIAMLNSTGVKSITSATSDEHEEKVTEEAKNAPRREPFTWEFGATYRRRSRLPPPLPKAPETSAISPGHSAQMNNKRKPGGGGPTPRNDLSKDRYNPKLSPPSKVPTRDGSLDPPAFNFHQEPKHLKDRPEQVANKRRRMNDGSSNPQGSSRSPIDVDHSQRGFGPSNPSQNYSSTSRHPSQKDGRVSEFNKVENIVKAGPRARVRNSISSESRVNGMDEQKTSAPRAVQANHFKRGDAVGVGEIRDDPISDADTNKTASVAKKPANYAVIIPSPSKAFIDDYETTLSKPSKLASKSRSTRSSAASSAENSKFSPYFVGAQSLEQVPNSSKSRSREEAGANTAGHGRIKQQGKESAARAHISTGNWDHDSSPDELALEQPDSSDRNNQTVANVLLNNVKDRKNSQQKPALSNPRSSVVLSDSEDDDRVRKNDIKPTLFSSSKKANNNKRKRDLQFEVRKVFGIRHKWFSSKGDTKWSVTQNEAARALIFMDEKGAAIDGLTLKYNSLSRIFRCIESSKMILAKSLDQTAQREHQILFELGSPLEAKTLVDALKASMGIIVVQKPLDHLEKVFQKTLERLDDEKIVSGFAEDDVALITMKSEARNAKRQTDIQEHKRTTGGRLLKDSMTVIGHESLPETAVEGQPHYYNHLDDDNDTQRRSRQPVLPPANFYGKSEEPLPNTSATYSTRSSSRIQARDRNQSPGAPKWSSPVLKWSEKNPEWTKKFKWKKSVVYPLQGKNKTTVDEQDIPRLDEDEFLNDNLIHFYFNFLEQRLLDRSPETARRILFMNSFFYLRLTSGVPGRSGINYEAVERWTAKVNIFEYDYIVVPVNEAAHWYLAIICNVPRLMESPLQIETEVGVQVLETEAAARSTDSQGSEPAVDAKLKGMSLNDADKKPDAVQVDGKTIHTILPLTDAVKSDGTNLKDSEIQHIDLTGQPKTKQSKKTGKRKSFPPRRIDTTKPRIITLDSLGGTHSSTCTNLKRWLIAEARSKRGFDIVDTGPFGMTAKGLPQQPNYCDCGVYLLMYLEKFLDDPDGFAAGILTDKHKEEPIFLPKASDKRNEIRDLLLHLQCDPRASMEDLKVIVSKYNQPPIVNKETPVLQTEIARQSEQEGAHTSLPSAIAREPKLNPVLHTQNTERAQHASLPQKLQSGAVETKTLGDESYEIDVGEVPKLQKSQSILKRISSVGYAGLAGIADKLTGGRQDKSTPQIREESRSAGTRSIAIPGSPGQPTLRQQLYSDVHAQSNEVDLRSPSPEKDPSHTLRRESGHIKDDVVRSTPERLASPNSSNTHTVENGDEGESHTNNLLSNNVSNEISDSQDDDADMLLNSTGDSMEGKQGATRGGLALLPEDSTKLGPNTSEEAGLSKSKSESMRNASQHPEVEKSPTKSPLRSRKRNADVALYEIQSPEDGQQVGKGSSRSRKRKVEVVVLESPHQVVEEQSLSSPSRTRRRRSSEAGEGQLVQRKCSEPCIDSLDKEMLGKYGKQEQHIHFEG